MIDQGAPAAELGGDVRGEAPRAEVPATVVVQRYAVAAGIVVSLVGVAVLSAWVVGVASVQSVSPELTPMKPNTALALVLLGLCIASAAAGRAGTSRRVAAAFVALIGLATLAEFALGWDTRLDTLLVATSEPRMAPTTALCLLLLGSALFVRTGPRSGGTRRSDALALISAVISYLALIGYLYGASQLYGIVPSARMALNTSITLILASLAAIAIDAEHGIAAILLRRTAGGLVARRFVPLAIVVIPLLGWLRLLGQRAGWYDTEFGTAVMVVTVAVLFVAATVRVAWLLDHAHVHRLSAEARAVTDELTGLPNRRVVDRELARLDGLAERRGGAYSVLAIDLDSLKQINDTQGHDAGDRALRRLADALRATLRAGDVAGRIGGDEFVALLPNTDRTAADAVADRLRGALFDPSQGSPRVAASIGVSTWRTGQSGRELLAEADRALYSAKARPAAAS